MNSTVLRLAFCAAALVASQTAQAAAPKVVVTIKPVHALVAGVMAGVGTPDLLVQGSASPHAFALKPSAAAAVHAADIFVRVSAAVEPFTVKLVQSLEPRVEVVTLSDAPGMTLLDRRQGGTFEAHAHAPETGAGAPPQDGEHDGDDEDEAGKDGHIWLDPVNAKAIVADIARVLSEADPADAAAYAANAATVAARIDTLSDEIANELSAVRGKPFVVFHDAYQYFEKRFGVDAIGSVTVSPDVLPSARRLSELRGKIKQLGAVCVFVEPNFQPALVAAVTEGTPARSATLDPEGQLLDRGPDLYDALMRGIASGMRNCLAG